MRASAFAAPWFKVLRRSPKQQMESTACCRHFVASTRGSSKTPPPHTYVGGGWVVLRPQSRFLAIFFKKCPSGRKRPCFVMARLCSFIALLWFALLFDLCGLRLKIRCYREGSLVPSRSWVLWSNLTPKSTPNSKWP
jgi:hypothetical protein